MQILIQLPKSCYSKRSLGQQHQCHWKHVRNTDSQVPAQTCRIRICIFRRSPHDPYAKLKPELHCFTTSFVVRENLERFLPTPGAWCTCVEWLDEGWMDGAKGESAPLPWRCLTLPAVHNLIDKWAIKPKWTEMHSARNQDIYKIRLYLVPYISVLGWQYRKIVDGLQL